MTNIYLVGFMGAGKSAVGRALAGRIAASFVDLDELLVGRLGMPIRDVFARDGEARFRTEEREALRWTTGLEDAVVATGGGAFCSASNREIIHGSGGRSVFLDVPWPVLAGRLAGDQSARPLFTTTAAARRLYRRRRPHYRRATLRIAVAGADSPASVAERIAGALAGAACAT